MFYRTVESGENVAALLGEEGQLRAADYWTEERVRNAAPMDANAPAGFLQEAEANSGAGEVVQADTSKPPYSAAGKLLFTMGGKDYWGAAQFCCRDGAPKNLILTAAHCLRDMDSGEWADNVAFDLGSAPMAGVRYVPVALALKSMWHREKDFRWDYGFLVVSKKKAAGFSLGYRINASPCSAVSIGYPSDYGLGEYMQSVKGSVAAASSGILQMQGNPMGTGCFGGAWIIGGTNTAISVNAFNIAGSAYAEFGPALDEKFDNLVEYAMSL